MKLKNTPLFALVTCVALGLAACSQKAAQADASVPLQESFKTEEPQVQQAISSVTTSLKAGNYAEATRVLAPIVTARQLTEPQKQAVAVTLQQINQAIAADPKLDTKEMYEMRAKMFQAMRGGSRF